MKARKFYITTPIYYANSELHIGGAYTTIAADVLARYHRLKGEKVFFLTGSDEHGQKIQEEAEKTNVKPKDFVDNIVKKWKETFKILNISNDHFIRTTDPEHEAEVKKLLQRLYDKGFIYKGTYASYYCIGCEQYKTKSDLVDGKCPLHNREPELKKEDSYMFRLSKFQNKLLDLIKNKKYLILPETRRNEVISFIESGLEDVSFSRLMEKTYWSIELPFDKKHGSWVWPDAFWNYLTGLIEKKVFDEFWPPDIQLMAKDIIRVHATIWPAMLMASGYRLPKTLFVHGFFTVNGQKMSKSLGNVISPAYLAQKYSPDSLRYFLIRNTPFGEDGDFNEKALVDRHNNELANDLGNLVSRVLTLAEKTGKPVKKYSLHKELKNALKLKEISSYMEAYEINAALKEIWKFINEANRYVNEKTPWALKDKKLEQVLYNLLEAIRIIAILTSPFLPATAEKINDQLGVKLGPLKDCKFGLAKEYNVKKGEILFKKI